MLLLNSFSGLESQGPINEPVIIIVL
jgi:hypothetical protein